MDPCMTPSSLFEKNEDPLQITDVSVYNDIIIKISWESEGKTGTYTLLKNIDKNEWYGFSEGKDKPNRKNLLAHLFHRFLDSIEIKE